MLYIIIILIILGGFTALPFWGQASVKIGLGLAKMAVMLLFLVMLLAAVGLFLFNVSRMLP